jgi:hypothetical protein
MGGRYFQIVKKCLMGDFSTTSGTDEVIDSNDPTAQEFQETRKWLEAFMTEAVNELENCAV